MKHQERKWASGTSICCICHTWRLRVDDLTRPQQNGRHIRVCFISCWSLKKDYTVQHVVTARNSDLIGSNLTDRLHYIYNKCRVVWSQHYLTDTTEDSLQRFVWIILRKVGHCRFVFVSFFNALATENIHLNCSGAEKEVSRLKSHWNYPSYTRSAAHSVNLQSPDVSVSSKQL